MCACFILNIHLFERPDNGFFSKAEPCCYRLKIHVVFHDFYICNFLADQHNGMGNVKILQN